MRSGIAARFLGWQDDATVAASEAPSALHKLLAGAFVLTLVVLQLRAMLGPHEDWPFTSAPMFAHHHAPDAPLYDFDFELEDPNGVRRVDPRADLGIGEMAFKRLFFADYYASTDPRHPAGHHPDDTPEQFSARLADFCRRIAVVIARRRGAPPRTIRIGLSTLAVERAPNGRIRPRTVLERRVIAELDVASGNLRRVPLQ